MTHVIGQPCVDVVDRACLEERPVEAIYDDNDLPDSLAPYVTDNVAFFDVTLPGRSAPLGPPGGAARLGALGVDTPLVTSLPPQNGSTAK